MAPLTRNSTHAPHPSHHAPSSHHDAPIASSTTPISHQTTTTLQPQDHQNEPSRRTKRKPDTFAHSHRALKRLVADGCHCEAEQQCTQLLAQLRSAPSSHTDANTASLLITRSIAREQIGALHDALKDAKAAIRAAPNQPAAYLRAAHALVAAGHNANARSSLATARKLLRQSTPDSASYAEFDHRRTLELAIDRLDASIAPKPLARLPIELFLRILWFLDVRHLLRTLSVSRRWRAEALAHPPLWRHLDLPQLASACQLRRELRGDGRRSRQLLARFCDLSRNSLVSLRLSLVGSHENTEAVLDMVRANASTLQQLQLERCATHVVFHSLLPLCRSLRDLEIQHPPSSRYSFREADSIDRTVAEAGIDDDCAQKLNVLRLETFGVHREAFCAYPRYADMLSQLRVLKICSPARECSPFVHAQLPDAHVFDAMVRARETLEEVRLSECQQVALRYVTAPARLDPASLVFARLGVLEGWLPRVVRGRRESRRASGLHFSFPALREVDVAFECGDDEATFYRNSPHIERLSHRAQLYPEGAHEPSERVALLEDLRELSIAYRPQVGVATAMPWQHLVPHVDPERGGTAVVACPKLTTLRIFYSGRELTGGLLVRLVLIRLFLSRGMTIHAAIAKARPESGRAQSVATATLESRGAASPFSRGSRSVSCSFSSSPSSSYSPSSGGQASAQGQPQPQHGNDPAEPLCEAITTIQLVCCEGVDAEAAQFLHKLVPKCTYTPFV
ncbi:hypothetical protein ACQY0O_003973 [Thecaphora frezii]